MADDKSKKKKKKSKDMMSGLGGIFDVAPQVEEEFIEVGPEEVVAEFDELLADAVADEDTEPDVDEPEGAEQAAAQDESAEEAVEQPATADAAAAAAAAELEAMKARVAELELQAMKAKVAELEAKVGKPPEEEKPEEKRPEAKVQEKAEVLRTQAAESTPAPEHKKKPASAIDGVFSPGGDSDFDLDLDLGGDDPYLDEDDLDGYEPRKTRGTTGMLVGIIAVALVALVVGLASAGFGPNDVALVLKGEYRQHKLAEKKRIEEEFLQKQLDALEKYGNLFIVGNPKYAQLKLDGELQYGEMSSSPGTWREVHLEPGISNFQNLKVKEAHTVEVSSPGFEPQEFEITEGKWAGEGSAQETTFRLDLNATLIPSTPFHDAEFKARMLSDLDNEFYGEITLNSVPAGATVRLDNHPLLDKNGDALKTPVTFTANYVRDDKGKLEERLVQVDKPLDVGHKVEVFMEGSELPKYATQINRPMWTCEQKPESETKKLAEDASPQMQCNYKFAKTVDLEGIKRFKEKREEERKRIEQENEKIRKLQAEALGNAGVPSVSANDPTKNP